MTAAIVLAKVAPITCHNQSLASCCCFCCCLSGMYQWWSPAKKVWITCFFFVSLLQNCVIHRKKEENKEQSFLHSLTHPYTFRFLLPGSASFLDNNRKRKSNRLRPTANMVAAPFDTTLNTPTSADARNFGPRLVCCRGEKKGRKDEVKFGRASRTCGRSHGMLSVWERQIMLRGKFSHSPRDFGGKLGN